MGRIKVDENLSVRAAQIFAARGHDVETVPRTNILRFPPLLSGGIVILKPGREMNLSIILSLAERAAELLASREVAGTLWIVEPGRVRMHEPSGNGGTS